MRMLWAMVFGASLWIVVVLVYGAVQWVETEIVALARRRQTTPSERPRAYWRREIGTQVWHAFIWRSEGWRSLCVSKWRRRVETKEGVCRPVIDVRCIDCDRVEQQLHLGRPQPETRREA